MFAKEKLLSLLSKIKIEHSSNDRQGQLPSNAILNVFSSKFHIKPLSI
jgi:hypothetical protein